MFYFRHFYLFERNGRNVLISDVLLLPLHMEKAGSFRPF